MHPLLLGLCTWTTQKCWLPAANFTVATPSFSISFLLATYSFTGSLGAFSVGRLSGAILWNSVLDTIVTMDPVSTKQLPLMLCSSRGNIMEVSTLQVFNPTGRCRKWRHSRTGTWPEGPVPFSFSTCQPSEWCCQVSLSLGSLLLGRPRRSDPPHGRHSIQLRTGQRRPSSHHMGLEMVTSTFAHLISSGCNSCLWCQESPLTHQTALPWLIWLPC